MQVQPSIPSLRLLKTEVTALCLNEQISLMLQWARKRASKFVSVANVHMLMEAYWNPNFTEVLQSADLVTPDGMPLVWMLKWLGVTQQDRVAGMDIFLNLCQLSPSSNVSVFFLGATSDILEKMKERLEREFPKLSIAGLEPLPFRPLTPQEDEALIERINTSGAGLLFLCLGCPKQEQWIAKHRHRIRAVMLGLGAVFPLYAGLHKRAPQWARESGLEWLYRLIQEPRRLWRRYLITVPPFVYLAVQQLLNASLKYLIRLPQRLFNRGVIHPYSILMIDNKEDR